MSPSLRRWLLLFAIIITVLVVDQVTKRIVVANLAVGETVPVLSPLFQITRSFNTGSAFGFLPQASNVFLVIAVVVVIAMLIFYPRIPADQTLTRLAVGLIVGGALGNALDRVEYGAVVDFIHYQIPNVISNVSNLADHAIVGGVILILIDSWLHDRRQRQAEAADEAAASPDGD